MKGWIAEFDAVMGVMFKYEIHAFVLLVTGLALTLHGQKEEGFAVISSALVIFKGKASGGS